MNEILLNIISVIVTAVVLPVISMLGTRLVEWISSKTKNEAASRLLTNATNAVLNAVRAVFQTYVDALKKEGKFDKQSQEAALKKATEIALSQMSDDVKEYIRSSYGDLELWIKITIESAINKLKNNSQSL